MLVLASWLLLGSCFRVTLPEAASDSGAQSAVQSDSGSEDSAQSTDSADDDGRPVVFISDGANHRFLYVEPKTERIIASIDLAERHPDICAGESTCIGFGGQPSVDAETGEDRALVVVAPEDHSTTAEAQSARVEMIRFGTDGPTRDWMLEDLDFSTHFGDNSELCAAEAACEAPRDGTWMQWRKCSLVHTHDVEVVSEDDDEVLMWIADTSAPARVMLVSLDKSSTCGTVLAALGSGTVADWPEYQDVNDVDLVEINGADAILVSSLSEGGEEGHGRISVWNGWNDEWSEVWHHPVNEGANLASPHNPDLFVASDGQTYLVYAHTNGAGMHIDYDDWTGERDHQGSIGVLRLHDGGFDYLADIVVSADRGDGQAGFGAIRDVDVLDDGSFLVTDSGCLNHRFTDCERSGAVWNVEYDVTQLVADGVTGQFSPDHLEQVFVEAVVRDVWWDSPLECGLLTPYESDLIVSSEAGMAIQEALEQTEGSCDQP